MTSSSRGSWNMSRWMMPSSARSFFSHSLRLTASSSSSLRSDRWGPVLRRGRERCQMGIEAVVRNRDVLYVPAPPVAALVATDQQDRLASWRGSAAAIAPSRLRSSSFDGGSVLAAPQDGELVAEDSDLELLRPSGAHRKHRQRGEEPIHDAEHDPRMEPHRPRSTATRGFPAPTARRRFSDRPPSRFAGRPLVRRRRSGEVSSLSGSENGFR